MDINFTLKTYCYNIKPFIGGFSWMTMAFIVWKSIVYSFYDIKMSTLYNHIKYNIFFFYIYT